MKPRLTPCLLAALLTLAATPAAFAATTYTCPSQVRAQDSENRASVILNLTAQTMTVTYNLFTMNPASGWSATAVAGFPVSCRVTGQVVDQGSRVLLVCNCVGELNHTQISANATYQVAGGSQCTYQGNLQFQCN